MKGVTYSSYGKASEVIECREDLEKPECPAGGLLVRQKATSINPADYKFMLGNLKIAEFNRKFPIIPCFDVFGEVVESRSPGFKAGDQVLGYASFKVRAAAADLVPIDASFCVPAPRLPDGALAGADGDAPAERERKARVALAGAPLVAVTSYQALVKHARLQPGETVLVLGGSSATGLLGVQIARAAGAARVLTTCGERNIALLGELGCDGICDYRKDQWPEFFAEEEKVDIIYDTVGGRESWYAALDFLSARAQAGGPKPRYVTIAGDRQDRLGLGRLMDTGVRLGYRRLAAAFGSPEYLMLTASPGDESLAEVAAMIEEGKVRLVVDSVYRIHDLEEVRQAFDRIMSGHCTGKVILEFADVGSQEAEGIQEEQ